MEKGDIIRWAFAFGFAIAFFVAMYLTIAPDSRIIYLPSLGLLFTIPLIIYLDKKYKVSGFEPVELRVPKKQLYILIGLATFGFLIFDFIYLTIPEFAFATNFYVGLTLFYLVYASIAFAGGPGTQLYKDPASELMLALILTATVGGFAVIASVMGAVIFPLGAITIPTVLYAILLILWAVLGAIIEELAFRGALAPLLASRVGIALSSVIVSLTFVVYHYLAYGVDPLALAYLFVMSMLLTLVTLYSGSLLPALVAHALNNFLAVLAIVHPLLGLLALGIIIAPFVRVEIRTTR